MVKKRDIPDIFKELDKINTDGALLSENALSVVDDWIDTGSYALNAIISGSLYKGVPNGRVVGFAGPSGCGKTLMSTKIVANFQKKSPDNWGIVFDSEIALDAATARALGADPERIKHYPVNSVLGVRNQALMVLNQIIEKGLQGKFIIVIDSLGNLGGGKEINDAEEDKSAADMGLRAKDMKSMLRTITYKAAKAKTTVVFTNHTYANPAAMYPSAVDNQSGGSGPIYMASLLVQLGFKREKNEKDHEDAEIIAVAKKVGGITMHALTVKNRFIPQMLTTDLYLNFKTGLDRYSGLFELAKAMGVLEGTITYTCEGLPIGRRKEIEADPKLWEKVLPVLEKKIQKEFAFHSDADILVDEVEDLNKSE
jgi:RecA/RadA recombinase